MKLGLCLAVALLAGVGARAQGLVVFANFGELKFKSAVTNSSTGDLLAGDSFSAQLWGGAANVSESSLAPISPFTPFLTGSQSGYFDGGLVTNGFVFPPDTGTFQVRVYQRLDANAQFAAGATLPTSVQIGASTVFQHFTGDANSMPPVYLSGSTGLKGFTVTPVPEPSKLALMGLSAAVILYRRMRK